MVEVVTVVGVVVAVCVMVNEVEVGTVVVAVAAGAVVREVDVAVKLGGVLVVVVQTVEVPIERYELQNGVAEDALSAVTTSLTARHSTLLTRLLTARLDKEFNGEAEAMLRAKSTARTERGMFVYKEDSKETANGSQGVYV